MGCLLPSQRSQKGHYQSAQFKKETPKSLFAEKKCGSSNEDQKACSVNKRANEAKTQDFSRVHDKVGRVVERPMPFKM